MATPLVVQTKAVAANAAGTTLAAAFTSNNKAGNMIIVVTGVDAAGAGAIATPTDTQGNTYTQIFNTAYSSSTHRGAVYYALNIKSGANTVTGHYDANNTEQSLIVREYSGVLTAAALDTNNTGTGSTTAVTSTTTATGNSYRLVLGFEFDDFGSSQTIAAGTGYGNLASLTSNSADCCALEDKLVGATGNETATFTLGSAPTTSWLGGVATFFASGGSYQPNKMRPHAFSPGLAR